MAPVPGLYSGKSTLALVQAKSHKKAEAKEHH